MSRASNGGTEFRKGDHVAEVLRGAGEETREGGTILLVKDGIAYLDNGPGNDPTAYDARTGRYAGDGLPGFTRWIEKTNCATCGLPGPERCWCGEEKD